MEPLEQEYEGIFQINLTRPEARNAIGRQLLRELVEALTMVRRERATRCLILRSSVPNAFCAGADLKERAGMTQQETSEFVSELRQAFSSVQALPMPTVAIVNGFALGGGAELALACDFRICGPAAMFAFPEVRLGIIPGAGGTQLLPRLVGRTKAKELIFTGRRVDAQEAFQIGLADYVVQQEDEADSRGLQLARDIAQGAPIALRMAKAAINQGMDVDLQTAYALEHSYYSQVIPTQDRLEGLRAFKEKREPVFQGT
ncbi:g2701 [Coccomyxa viridis]|uniref:G2701 protein n=1 Tax=Coccomyxa viridis TaxID=1274662 RepID=A0ABP1FP12_9CHLO